MSRDEPIDPFAPEREIKTEDHFQHYLSVTAGRLQVMAWAYDQLCYNATEDDYQQIAALGREMLRQTAWAMRYLEEIGDWLSFERSRATGEAEGGRHG